jgi:hypothetical protein
MYWLIVVMFVAGCINLAAYCWSLYTGEPESANLILALLLMVYADTTYFRYTLNSVTIMEMPDDS